MVEISSVGIEELSVPVFESEECSKEEASSCSTQAKPFATQEQMVHEEALTIATTPNIRNAQRILEVKSELRSTENVAKQFYLFKELFILGVELYLQEEKSTDELNSAFSKLIQASDQEEFNNLSLNISDEVDSIIFCYLNLGSLAEQLKEVGYMHFLTYIDNFLENPKELKEYAFESYQCYYLQMYELETSLGLNFFGTRLLTNEIFALLKIWKDIFDANKKLGVYKSNYLFSSLREERNFFWHTLATNFHRSLDLLDQQTSSDDSLSKMAQIVSETIFDSPVTEFHPYNESTDFEKVNLVELYFPLVVKYGNLAIMEERFNDIEMDLPEQQRKEKWIDLHLQAGKLLEPTQPEKAKAYFAKAEELKRSL